MVPENIKNIAWRLSPDNEIVRDNERWMAAQQLEIIREYCEAVLKVYNKV